MAACDSKDWNMTLVVVKDDKPSGETRLNFVNVEIILGLISGDVESGGQKVSQLHGICTSLGKKASLMTFRFNLRGVEIFLVGIAFEDQSKVIFQGVFRAFESGIRTSSKKVKAPDAGETGTGTGMQAMTNR